MTEHERRGLTRFGSVVMALATERGYRTQKSLAELVDSGPKPPAEKKVKVSQHRLGRWLRGDHDPPWWFCELLAELLDLSDEELERLAMANTYGQRTFLDGAA